MEYAYVGSFTTEQRNGLGHGGISVFSRQPGDEEWKRIQVYEMLNPSFLTFGKEERILYAAQGDGCMVTAFSIHEKTGKIKLLNEKHIGLFNSVSVTTDNEYKYLFVACLNNGHGAILSLRLNQDGSIGEICDIEVPQGNSGPLYPAQAGTQPHQVKFDREGRYLSVCDKGLDEIHTYSVDDHTGRFLLKKSTKFPMSCCPRHVDFHPKQKYAYLLTEWIGGVISCQYDEGAYMLMENLKTTPSRYVGIRNVGAEIEVHPSGKFLYASNRGYDSLVVFRIETDGYLKPVEWCSEGVVKPRFFVISKDGKRLYCANEGNHSVSIYSIDLETGKLSFMKTTLHVSDPACILFREPKFIAD